MRLDNGQLRIDLCQGVFCILSFQGKRLFLVFDIKSSLFEVGFLLAGSRIGLPEQVVSLRFKGQHFIAVFGEFVLKSGFLFGELFDIRLSLDNFAFEAGWFLLGANPGLEFGDFSIR